nr:MAG TPA: hypothetical protein [Caudoviricetes sp.]
MACLIGEGRKGRNGTGFHVKQSGAVTVLFVKKITGKFEIKC